MKIISGGQTGADRGALEAAIECGVETGGFAPRGYLTEIGNDISLKNYGLVDSGLWYPKRTELNAKSSDMTIWFGRSNDYAGLNATKKACKKHGKPFVDVSIMFAADIRDLIKDNGIVNVAGNRESKTPGIQEYVRKIMCEVLKDLK
jgi:hypothetical protein